MKRCTSVAKNLETSTCFLARSAMVLLLLSGSSCLKAQVVALGSKVSVTSPVPTLSLNSPSAGTFIHQGNRAAFVLSGSCSENTQSVVIGGAVSTSTSCNSGAWSVSLNLSAQADGPLLFTMDHVSAAGIPAAQVSATFTKDSSAPAPFSITGISGGSDATVDAFLLDHQSATIGWNDTTGENGYSVTVYQSDGTTVQCTSASKAADSTSHDFSPCSLTYNQDYYAVVVATNSLGVQVTASNSPFAFKVNRKPSAVADTKTISLNAAATAVDVLANDTDPDSNTLTVSSVNTTGTSGTVTNNGTNVSYTPANGFIGTDTFAYTISDGRGGTATATVTITVKSAFIWTGGGSDANWTTSGNWCGTIVNELCTGGPAPGASDVAIFDSSCTSNCSPTIDSNISIGGLSMRTGYTGTITQDSTRTIAVGATGWSQVAGTFVGNDANITISGNLSITGGSFTSTSATLSVLPSTGSTPFTLGSSATFTHNGGSATIRSSCAAATVTLSLPASGISFHNLTFSSSSACNANFTPTSGSVITVENDFNHQAGKIMGTIHLKGNLSVSGNAGHPGRVSINYGANSTGSIVMNGTGNQTYAYSAGRTTSLNIDKATGTVTAAGGTTNIYMERFVLTQGSFTAPTGRMGMRGDTSLKIFDQATGTTFDPATGSTEFLVRGTYPSQSNVIDFPGSSITFNDVYISSVNEYYAHVYQFGVLRPATGKKIIVSGNFYYNTSGELYTEYGVMDGAWELQGNADFGEMNWGVARTYGNATISFTGSANQIVRSIHVNPAKPYFPGGTLTVDKAGGTLTLGSNLSLLVAAQAMNIVAGTVDMAGYSLTVPGTLTISAGATLTQNLGTLTTGSTNNSGTLNP